MSGRSPKMCGNVLLNEGTAWTAGKAILPAHKAQRTRHACVDAGREAAQANTETYTCRVTVSEAEYALHLIESDMLPHSQSVLVELRNLTIKGKHHSSRLVSLPLNCLVRYPYAM